MPTTQQLIDWKKARTAGKVSVLVRGLAPVEKRFAQHEALPTSSGLCADDIEYYSGGGDVLDPDDALRFLREGRAVQWATYAWVPPSEERELAEAMALSRKHRAEYAS